MTTESSSNSDLYKTNPEQWLADTVTGPDLVCLVFFRGSWCKYDKYYLKKLGEHHKTVDGADKVRLIAWTSEGPEGAAKADAEWGLTTEYGYDAVLGDESNALPNWLVEDEILPDLVIIKPEEAKVTDIIKPGSYPNGIAMPAMIWYAHHGNIVFQWVAKYDASAPLPCGPGRPDFDDLWKQVKKRKHALDLGSSVMPSHGTNIKLIATDADIV